MTKRWIAILSAYILLFTGCAVPSNAAGASTYVLLDPGHGGVDGGTAASDGTLEKDINLLIALQLRDLMRVCGINVAMTRETDITVADPSCVSIHDKKVSDLRNRLSMYQSAALVISIHQNYFEHPKYRGTQVFYSPNHAQSARLAEAVQQAVCQHLQKDNARKIKSATDGIYLMHHTTVPAILVECGFLSNPKEAALLKQDVYRQQLAFALMAGYWNYCLGM